MHHDFARYFFYAATSLCSLAALALFLSADVPAPYKFMFFIAVLAVLVLSRSMLLPAQYYRYRLLLPLIVAASGATLAYFSATVTLTALVDLAAELVFGTTLNLSNPARHTIDAVLLGGIWVCVVMALLATRAETIMPAHTNDPWRLKEEPFRRQLNILSNSLRDHLERVDSETDWSHHHYVPLKAQVEYISSHGTRQRVTDLNRGIQHDKASRLYVVLGDPGSGKSVALRKLARDLLSEVDRTKRIPIYVNLREWTLDSPWTTANPPTSDAFREFLLKNIRGRLATPTVSFVDTHFDELLASGSIFLILDSFDEMPAVLDAPEGSWVIRELSSAITQVVLGGVDSRGVIASRHFKRLIVTRSEFARLEILPLADRQISKLIEQQAPQFAKSIKVGLFSENPNLGRIARSPFLLSLLVNFVEANRGSLPRTQAELFESFIDKSIQAGAGDLIEFGLDREQVLLSSEEIAYRMFTSETTGLSARIDTLTDGSDRPAASVMEFLSRSRIGRLSERRFSFVHRRFNEYFLIRSLLEKKRDLPLDSIAEDGRWRDAMVLYVELAPRTEAKHVAKYCIRQMKQLLSLEATPGMPSYLRGIHCLRFLIEAFRGRARDVGSLAVLSRFVYRTLHFPNQDILVLKHAVEASGLLTTDLASDTLADAVAYPNSWISTTAVRSSRYLPSTDERLTAALREFIADLPDLDLIFDSRDLALTFELSPALQEHHAFYLRRRSLKGSQVGLSMLTTIIFPFLAVLIIVLGKISQMLQMIDGAPEKQEVTDLFRKGTRAIGYVIALMTIASTVAYCIKFTLFSANVEAEPAFDALSSASNFLGSFVFSTVAELIPPTWVNALYFVFILLVLNADTYWMPIAAKSSSWSHYGRKLWYEWRWAIAIWILVAIAPALHRLISPLLPALEYDFIVYIFRAIGVLLIVALILSGIALLVLAFDIHTWPSRFRKRRRDRARLIEAKEALPRSRSDIARALERFELAETRDDYVRFLLRNSERLRSSFGRSDNLWPSGDRPVYEDGLAGTLLAKFDERVWGLAD